MFRSTLVAQLLTLALDSQGVDAASVQAILPEEFAPDSQQSEGPPRRTLPWENASPDLKDSVTYLLENHLARLDADGVLVPELPLEGSSRFSLDGRDEGFGLVLLFDESEMTRFVEARGALHDFDQPRLES